CPLPVARSSATAARARGFALLSRKLGCGVDTKCPDIHPKPGRLESNSTSALRRPEPALHRQGLAHNNEGRSLPRLQTVYPLPSHQRRRRLPHHSPQSQSGAYTLDKDCPRSEDRPEVFAF